MWWITVGLIAIGAACGALIRLPLFLGVLIGGAIIAGGARAPQGVGAAVLSALVTVIVLQVGYVAGLILRAVARSRHAATATRAAGKPPVSAPLGQKRR
ncbi:MAG TPA: hypothetical protein VGG57_00795 [Stellaceae bacterium]|jgi:hypothetical protein